MESVSDCCGLGGGWEWLKIAKTQGIIVIELFCILTGDDYMNLHVITFHRSNYACTNECKAGEILS